MELHGELGGFILTLTCFASIAFCKKQLQILSVNLRTCSVKLRVTID